MSLLGTRDYRPIADYGIIGDQQTAALIASDGSIDWACLPFFDSPAVFLRLLDRRRGGYCAIQIADLVRSVRRYAEGTNILESTFFSASGTLVITDFMPVQRGNSAERCCRIIRLLRCVAGHVDFTIECKPSFSFGSVTPQPQRAGTTAVQFRGGSQGLVLEGGELAIQGDGSVVSAGRLSAGDAAFFAISDAPGESQPELLGLERAHSLLRETGEYWTDWSGRLRYEGHYRNEVLRSALLLKLLTFAPTGAMVAAPTTSLPEAVGGSKNWDYRLSWIRDSQFALTALMHCGYLQEARDFFSFVKKAAARHAGQLQILYDIRGECGGEEHEAPGLEGYRCSRPVRIGNAAGHQKQSDVYGELLNCFFVYCHMTSSKTEQKQRLAEVWPLARDLADHVLRHWREPDQGIWESRQAPQQFVHSKAMCWTALDRAIRLAPLADAGEEVARWKPERDLILKDVLEHGFNASAGAFVQTYGSDKLDAAVLRLPLVGVVEARNPLMQSTIAKIEQRLQRNGLLLRYLNAAGASEENAFTSCTLWLINNYVLLGRKEAARECLDHLLSFRNDLGLYSEEVDPATGEQQGNFPQALTHVALISSIRHLEGFRPGSLHAIG